MEINGRTLCRKQRQDLEDEVVIHIHVEHTTRAKPGAKSRKVMTFSNAISSVESTPEGAKIFNPAIAHEGRTNFSSFHHSMC